MTAYIHTSMQFIKQFEWVTILHPYNLYVHIALIKGKDTQQYSAHNNIIACSVCSVHGKCTAVNHPNNGGHRQLVMIGRYIGTCSPSTYTVKLG